MRVNWFGISRISLEIGLEKVWKFPLRNLYEPCDMEIVNCTLMGYLSIVMEIVVCTLSGYFSSDMERVVCTFSDITINFSFMDANETRKLAMFQTHCSVRPQVTVNTRQYREGYLS